MFTQLNELVCLSMGHCFVGDSLEGLRTLPNLIEEFIRTPGANFAFQISHKEIKTINVFPHLTTNLLADTTRVLPRQANTSCYGAWIFRVPEQELTDIFGVVFLKAVSYTHLT